MGWQLRNRSETELFVPKPGDKMKRLIFCTALVIASVAKGQCISCPATHNGKKLTNAIFDEWLSASSNRSMALDRRTLMPEESRVEGEDWFQRWDVTHAVTGNGLQMICQYQGLPAGLFIEVKENVSVCTLTKKNGAVTVGCK